MQIEKRFQDTSRELKAIRRGKGETTEWIRSEPLGGENQGAEGRECHKKAEPNQDRAVCGLTSSK